MMTFLISVPKEVFTINWNYILISMHDDIEIWLLIKLMI